MSLSNMPAAMRKRYVENRLVACLRNGPLGASTILFVTAIDPGQVGPVLKGPLFEAVPGEMTPPDYFGTPNSGRANDPAKSCNSLVWKDSPVPRSNFRLSRLGLVRLKELREAK